MSKDKNKNGNVASTPTPPTADETGGKPEGEEKPKASPEQLKKLYAECVKFEAEYKKHNDAAEAVKTKRSAAIKALLDAGGPGPYTINGERRTIAKAAKGDGYYFRGKDTREAISLD